MSWSPASIGGHGEPERVWGQAATANFFDVAQLGMTLGRGFSSDEERLPVIVLSHSLWRRRFGADSGIAGKVVTSSGRPFTVVGVAVRGLVPRPRPRSAASTSFRGLDLVPRPRPRSAASTSFSTANSGFRLAILTSYCRTPATTTRASYRWAAVAGRLKPGVTRTVAGAELKVLAQRLAQAHPEAERDGGFRFEQAGSLPPRYKSAVMLFLTALTVVAQLVLSIACANVANLLLAQAASRQKEMAVRLALGATRGRLLRQMLTESVLLAIAGGLAGLALSLWAAQSLSMFRLPAPVPLDLTVSVDWRVLLYTFALSVGTGLLFGLAPAWAAARPILSNALKGEDALARPGRRWTLRNILVVSQIAMSLLAPLCATGLFLRSLGSASSIDIGFRSRGIVMMAVDPRFHGYTSERTAQFLTQLRERVAALTGVASAAWTDTVPLSMGAARATNSMRWAGRIPRDPDLGADLYMVTPGYFEAMGIPRVAGRDFAGENATVPKAAVVNEVFAQRLFPSENASANESPAAARLTRSLAW